MDEITKEVVRPREPAELITKIAENLTRTVETAGLDLNITSPHHVTLTVIVEPGDSVYFTYDTSSYFHPDATIRSSVLSPNRHVHLLAVRTGQYVPDVRTQYIESLDDNPWWKHGWFRRNALIWAEHFPAPSETTKGLLAYYQTPEKRARDIRTPIKPGKYLKKFFGDILSDEEIHEAALEWSTHFAVREVKITQDADEIETLYRGNYLGSCMHFGPGGWSGSCHPARVYAGPDLGMAYIGPLDKADARCLVWPEKKIYYAKWYGDGPRLEAALIAAGYSSAYNEEFFGARIRRIVYGRGFVVPYVDVTDEAEDEGNYLVLRYSGSVNLRNTNGLSFDTEDMECDDCGRDYDSDDEGYTTYTGRAICDRCYDRNYFTCQGTDDVYPDSESIRVNGNLYSEDYAREHFFYCEYSSRYVPHDETVETVDGETVAEEYAQRHGFHCAYSEQWDLDMSHRIRLDDGRFVSSESFHDLHTFLQGEDVSIAQTLPTTDRLAA